MKAKGIVAIALGAALVLGGCGSIRGECAHEWSTWKEETAPTCTEEGTEKRSCPKCGKEERQKTPAAGHKWGTWQEKEAPTCTEKGTQERECGVCHEKETKSVDALGHAEGVWTSDNEGHWKICPVCEEALTEKEPHTAENGECTVCGGEVLGLEYAVYENECHVIGIGTESGDITIPAMYCGKPVTEIAEKAFFYEDITSVVIPDSVVYIRRIAFYQCASLRRVKLGSSVKEIGEQAFNWDKALTEVELNSSLETIGDGAFTNCAFTEIELPSSLQSIGQNAFYGSGIVHMRIPDSVQEVGESAFYGCENLESMQVGKGVRELPHMFCYGLSNGRSKLSSVVLSEGLETIGGAAFSQCAMLTQISIPSTVRTISETAFNRTGLTEIVIPNTVETLESNAFSNCESLTRVVIGDGVTSIKSGTFYCCSVLSDMTVGSGVQSIAKGAFQGCENLTSIKFRGSTDAWKEIEKEGDRFGTWKPTVKSGPSWSPVLTEVICNNGTLTGDDMG